MMTLEKFYQKYPQQTTRLSDGKTFTYRYYKNPKAKATIVLLTGGIVAQIIASKYPEYIEGLVLSNTCSLEKDMEEAAYLHLMNMIKSQEQSKKLLSFIPFSLFKKLIKWAVMKKKTENFSQEKKH